MSPRSRIWRSRAVLIGLFLVFFVPVVGSLWLTLSRPGWLPFGQMNYGDLVSPARRMDGTGLSFLPGEDTSSPALTGKWTMIYAAGEGCADACRRVLFNTRQAYRSLGRDRARVQRLLLFDAVKAPFSLGELKAHHPDLRFAFAPTGWLNDLPLNPESDSPAQFVYVVDPRGYLMLRFDWNAEIKGMLKDLRRLMKFSKVG